MTAGAGSGSPLVSIITPTLNRAGYLDAVLRSVRQQTYENIEHIVIDGGSSDGTVELLEKAERELGIRWLSEPDTGMYSAVNKGLRMAQGEIFAYLNTDDHYFPYSVEVAVDVLSDGSIGFVYGDMLNHDEARNEGVILFYPPFSSRYLRTGGFIGQPTVFWKAAVTQHLGSLREDLQLAADHEYWRRIAASFQGRKVHEVMAYEEQHPGRLTSGAAAQAKGTAELQSVRRSYFGDRRSGVAFRLFTALHRAWWQRVLTVRFLWSRLRSRHVPGKAWGGFHSVDGFGIRVGGMLLGLIPVLGRGHKRSLFRR